MIIRQGKQVEFYILSTLFAVVLACTTITAQTGSTSQATNDPTPAPGTSAQVPPSERLMSPGKIDFQYRHRALTEEYNFVWISPVAKGGFGFINSETTGLTQYQGIFFRPLLPLRKKDDLIVGLQRVRTRTDSSWEFQGEYRFAFGLGLGGGFVRSSNEALRTSFAKASFRKKHATWNYILATQAQKVLGKTSLGGYGAVYDEKLMLTIGTDTEQWRTSLGYIASARKSRIRPAFEILYVNNAIGRRTGPKSLFINGSLSYYGRFLSHASRLGRAMGPTGLEFGNPNGFLAPGWNRRLDVWELGDVVNFRLDRVTQANGAVTGRHEVVAFPLQFDKRKSRWDRFFGGLIYIENATKQYSGIEGGYFGNLGKLEVTVKSEYIFGTREKGFSFGMIRRF